MAKYDLSDLSMIRVGPDDPHLENSMPLIGIEQGKAHETRLPDRPEHMPFIARNFRDVLRQGHVEIWRLENPVPGCGAVCLSPLEKQGEQGIQIDDIVVLPEYRRKGLGSLLVSFVAGLARQRGLSFVSWECEDHNPARNMYRAVGAVPRHGKKPFRLSRDIILKSIQNAPDFSQEEKVSFSVSSRFSLFRTLNYGISGYDMDPTQKSLGLQIEDLVFEDMADARAALIKTLAQYRHEKGIDFVDIVIPADSTPHLELIASFDAEQNTYSGNPAFLWELTGDAFDKAAAIGQKIPVLKL